ncbi:MAG: TasA family protein [Ferrimicrobium acidiphilum]
MSHRTTVKIAAIASGALLAGAAAGVLVTAGPGHSVFQSQLPPASSKVSTASIDLTSGSASTLTVAADNIIPGDSIQRLMQLNNTGTGTIGNVSLSASFATNPTALVTSSTGGLQFEAQTCSTSWTATSLPGGGDSYSCSGTTSTAIASEPIDALAATTPTPLSGLSTIAPGGSQDVVLTLTLPRTDGNTYQALTQTIAYTFVATQAAATNA